MKIKLSYPTQIELIRALSTVLDLQSHKKKLNEDAYNGAINPKRIDELYSMAILKPLVSIIGLDLTTAIEKDFLDIKKDYLQLMKSVTTQFLSRKEVTDILFEDFFAIHLVKTIKHICQYSGNTNELVKLLFSENSSVRNIINWLDLHNEKWQSICNQMTDKSKLYAWKRSDNIPSTQSIKSFDVDFKIKSILLLASVIERLKLNTQGSILLDKLHINLQQNKLIEISYSHINEQIQKCQNDKYSKFENIYILYNQLDNKLKQTKTLEDQQFIENLFISLENLCETTQQTGTFRYYINWLQARFLVFSGKLDEAYKQYQNIVEPILHIGGKNQSLILGEALVVAANLYPKSKVLLKQLKWAAITFGYDIPSTNISDSSIKFEDNIEYWEIEQWKVAFNLYFPEELFFPNCEIKPEITSKGVLIEDAIPDLVNLNRKNQKTKMPQLNYFILTRKHEPVRRLLENGARADVSSNSNETPILMALQSMNLFSYDLIEPDDTYFNLLLKYADTKQLQSTINTMTIKRKLLPIISAVESGRIDVVEKVLALKADPNVKGSTGNETALSYCLKHIAQLKNPSKYWSEPFKLEVKPDWSIIDTIRRYNHGQFGFTKEQISQYLKVTNNSPFIKEIESTLIKLHNEYIVKYTSIEALRAIAKLLIDHKADVNVEDDSVIKGYTPFMLAAEIDEAELFKYMYEYGGDLSKTYRDYRTGKDVDIKEIASYFKSDGILDFLNTL